MDTMNWTIGEEGRRTRLLHALAEKIVPLTPRPILRVEQRGEWDCGFACLAMVLHTTVEEIAREVGRAPDEDLPDYPHPGLISEEICRVLWDHRVQHLHWSTDAVFAGPHPECGHHHAQWRWNLRGILHVVGSEHVNAYVNDGGTAILGVEGANNGHWVVAAGREILDPAPGASWELGRDIPINEAVLIRMFPHAGT